MIDVRKKLQDELNVIERELRVDLPKEILKAREHGDLSENCGIQSRQGEAILRGRKKGAAAAETRGLCCW